MEIFFMRINTFFHLDLSKKMGHSIAQNRQRDNILKHFIGLTSDSDLKREFKTDLNNRSKIFVAHSFILAQLQILASLVYSITVLGFVKNAHHIACRVSIRYLNKIIVPDVIVTRSLFILTDISICIVLYPNLLIASVVIFILIRMLNAAEALYRQVNESESCANLQPVKLLNYLRY